MENLVYELSEVFLPGEQAPFQLATLKQAFTEIMEMPSESIELYEKVINDAPTEYTGSHNNPLYLSSDLVPDSQLIASVINPESQDDLRSGLEFLLCYNLGLSLSDKPSLPLKPDVVMARSLRLAKIAELSEILLRHYTSEVQCCCEQLENPPPDSNAAKQVSGPCNCAIQLLFLQLCAENLLNQEITGAELLMEMFEASVNLLEHLSGIIEEKLGKHGVQTFEVPNARCFASVRVACLLREISLRLLGPVGDFKEADVIREQKMRSQQISPITIEENFNKLPPPRFYGYVNQECGEMMKLVEEFEGEFANNLFREDSPVEYIYGNTPSQEKQIDENNNLLATHINVINEKRQRGPVQILQEMDYLTQRKEGYYYKLFSCYPEVTACKGSVEGIELIHGASLAMQLAADCRMLQSEINSINETPNGNGANTIRYMPENGQFEEILNNGDPTEGQTTTLLYDKLCRGLCMPFEYCGRPGMYKYARKYLQKSIDINFGSLDGLNLSKEKIMRNMEELKSLDLESAILNKPIVVERGETEENSWNLVTMINSIDFRLFLQSVQRLSLCSVPNTQDAVFNKHQLPEANGIPTNNHTCSVRHVREVVLKNFIHTLLIFIYHSKRAHPALHRYVQRIYQDTCVLDAAICVMAISLGSYCSTADERLLEYGLCLFEQPNQTLSFAEENADASEYLMQKEIEIDTRPLAAYSSTRRLFISIACGKLIYGAVMHAKHRQEQFQERFQKVSANFISAILQANVTGGNVEQKNEQEVDENMNMSQTVVQRSNLNRFISDIGQLGIKPGTGNAQSNMVYESANIYNLIDFLNGNNQQNNPQRENMSMTLGCSFPGYELIRINNISAVTTFLKLCLHILPAISGSIEEQNYASAFEIPGLIPAREMAIKLSYQMGISIRQVDSMRWNKDAVYKNSDIKDYLEARSLEALAPIIQPENLKFVLQEIVDNGVDKMDCVVESALVYCGEQ